MMKRKKKDRRKIFLGDVEWKREWSKDEKELAWAMFASKMVERSRWLETNPKLPKQLRRVKHPNGIYGIEIKEEYLMNFRS